MSIEIVLQQMIIIFILITIGIILHKKNMFSDMTSTQVSSLIVNVTNPALLICSAFDDSPKVSLSVLGLALLIYLAVYAVLIAAGYLIPYLLRIPGTEHYAYKMLTVFGNVGFIGIPLASAVLGTQSLIFVSIYNLIFNVLIYTFGVSVLQKAKGGTKVADKSWKKLINAGTISAVFTIFFYLSDIRVPVILSSSLSYTGKATTLLSMLVLGVSVAQMRPREIFTHPKLYGFVLLRQILIPIGCVFLVRCLTDNALIVSTLALMLAVPCANMPLMLSRQLDLDGKAISEGIILTTVLSLVTIPVVSLFL